MPEKKTATEYLKNTTKTKQVFFYKDEENGIDVKSREVFLSGKKEIHYPFGRDGKQKYKNIESIEFRDVAPSDIKGVYKSPKFGMGFTKNLSPIIYELKDVPEIKNIIITENKRTQITKNKLVFSKSDLEAIFNNIKRTKDIQSGELKRVSNNQLANVLSEKFSYSGVSYKGDDLSAFINDKNILPKDLSGADIEGLVSLIPEEITEEKVIYRAEEKINFIKLNKAKEDLNGLIGQSTDTKVYEERCQKFLTKNSWIFSNILSVPVAILGGKTYVGGKAYDNTGGKEADFLYRNKLTKNVCVFEIKTPLKKLFDSQTPYRKPDIFPLGKELTGGVVQVLDQRDKLQKDFYSLVYNSSEKFNVFSPKCVLLIGKITDLNDNQIKCFELYRNNLSNVEIITFDELSERTELILGEFIDNSKKNKKT